ncbi:extracellular solute-binding protein [Pseudochrobactrum sp. HB0163]|uniref:extracellular solute-binding protein n=1 Tax=Pseudochrobactrum sp. HB0163 TaxID=3450708 RepID=UPI003F6DFC34
MAAVPASFIASAKAQAQEKTAPHDQPAYALSMHGDIALKADFTHFPYANADAPKGGTITYGVVGTFDSLNPFVLQSMRTTARGMFNDGDFGNLVYETLMQRSADEPFTLYGLLAESVKTDDARSFIEFSLNPAAKWSDGLPVTPEDVIFTYDILTQKGRPPYNARMSRIAKIEKTGERGIRFTFNDKADREFPLLLAATMPVLPRHAVDRESFGKASLRPPVASGPYLVENVKPGERITYRRNPDYWGKNLPSRRGFSNFDTVIIEYFRNETAYFEAFKKGIVDVYVDGSPNHWNKAYDFPAHSQGKVIKETFTKGTPANMLGFVFNTRREKFANVKVRRALSELFDFEWANRSLFSDQYERITSFWQGSVLSSAGRPASEGEKQLLAAYQDRLLPEVMDGTWQPATTDGSGHDRRPAKKAYNLLVEAGFQFENGVALTPEGTRLSFEIMTRSVDEEKLALAYKRNLARLGIIAEIRSADDAQYQQRLQNFDYDMIIGALSASLSPGNEQWMRWGSASRDAQGSFNYPGAQDQALDAMIEAMLAARDRANFTDAVRAFDRLLISGSYYLPLYYLPKQQVARWSHIKIPQTTSLYGYQFPTWWAETTPNNKG